MLCYLFPSYHIDKQDAMTPSTHLIKSQDNLTTGTLQDYSLAMNHQPQPDGPKLCSWLFLFCFVLFFETGFLRVTALAVLELALVDQAGLRLTEICLPLPPKCWD